MPVTIPDHSDRTVLVTGATSGLGLEATRRLAAAGAHVILAARNPDKAAETIASLRAAQPDASLSFRELDLASLASIEAFASGIEADGQGIDTLINNAGVMMPPTRHETLDGHELQWGTNLLGPYTLTARLLPTLLRSDRPRVAIQASAMGHLQSFRADDVEWRRRYIPWRAYANSKLADLLFGLRLAELSQEHGWGLRSTMAHPGYTRTGLQTAGPQMGGGNARSAAVSGLMGAISPGAMPVEWGVEPILLAAASDDAPQAAYYGPRGGFGMNGPGGIIKLPRTARNPGLPARVVALAEEATGLSLGATRK